MEAAMKIWEYAIEEGAASVMVRAESSNDAATRSVDQLFSSSERLSDQWTPLVCDLEKRQGRGKALKLLDLTQLDDGHLLVANAHARTKIEGEFGNSVEFLPLAGDATGLWVMHILIALEAICEERSAPLFEGFDWSSEPYHPIGPQIGFTSPYFFKQEIAASAPVFVDRKVRRSWFMGEAFHEFFKTSGLTGYRTRLIFDSSLHSCGFDAFGELRRCGGARNEFGDRSLI